MVGLVTVTVVPVFCAQIALSSAFPTDRTGLLKGFEPLRKGSAAVANTLLVLSW
jgi:hypothetical protein